MAVLKRLVRSRAGKVSLMAIIVLVLVVYTAAFTLPSAINEWIGNGTVIHYGDDATGSPNTTLNTLWVTVGGIVLVAIVLIAFLRSR